MIRRVRYGRICRSRGGVWRFLRRWLNGTGIRVAQGLPDVDYELVDRVVPINEQVNPLSGTELQGVSALGFDILQAQRNHGKPAFARKHDFFFYLVGVVCIDGKNEHHDLAARYCTDDLVAEVHAQWHVARCNPARYAAMFQGNANRIGQFTVRAGVADEYQRTHMRGFGRKTGDSTLTDHPELFKSVVIAEAVHGGPRNPARSFANLLKLKIILTQ